MTYRGVIRNGVVVFVKPSRLKDGTSVRVAAVASGKRKKPASRKPLQPVGRWAGGVEELNRLLTEVQQLREADLSLERA